MPAPTPTPTPTPTPQPPAVRELHYRIGSPVLGHFPGHHRSSRGDGGFEFRGHAALLDAPDVRRLDLHASLRDPFCNWVVRVCSQRKAIPVVMVADLSASLDFTGSRRKLDVVADFVESLGWSAWRTGDTFAFIGCDEVIRDDVFVSPTRSREASSALARTLRGLSLKGRSASALPGAHRHLIRQRSLVFLVSDFHLPLPEIEAVLASMAHHDLVPVVVWDKGEFTLSARRGLAQVVDPESGRRQLVWWRPALRDKWRAAQQLRRAGLMQLFGAHRLKPLFIEGAFNADDVTRYFHS